MFSLCLNKKNLQQGAQRRVWQTEGGPSELLVWQQGWHPDSRKAIKEMMRIELSDGDVVDNETLSYQTSHLLKATTVALARERALAFHRLAKNLREFHHEHGDALTQVQEDDEE